MGSNQAGTTQEPLNRSRAPRPTSNRNRSPCTLPRQEAPPLWMLGRTDPTVWLMNVFWNLNYDTQTLFWTTICPQNVIRHVLIPAQGVTIILSEFAYICCTVAHSLWTRPVCVTTLVSSNKPMLAWACFHKLLATRQQRNSPCKVGQKSRKTQLEDNKALHVPNNLVALTGS